MKPLTFSFIAVLAPLALGLAGCGGEATPAPATPADQTPAPPATPEPPALTLQVITGSPEGFLVNSAIVSGEKEAVLIDAQFTLADARKVAAAITASNKRLTTVYVTHWHPDHYFGFVALKEVFPDAKLVALPVTVAEIQQSWQAKVKQWQPIYKDAIPTEPIVPEPIAGHAIELEGRALEIVGGLQGDDDNNSYVWIPSLGALITGDLVFDDVYPWTAETTPAARQAWAASLDQLASLHPKRVVAGHQKPERGQDAASIQFTKDYLRAYDEALASSKNAAELQAKVKQRYPDAALDIVLKIGAEASLPPASAKKKGG
jgi:glyoxylase-like metal-dependent hydrolase (beta-lactamase superfamily II)